MSLILRNICIAITLIVCSITSLKAQPRKGEFIDASIGIGYSFPNEDIDISGSGFYAQGEYVFGIYKWFGIRPYAGILITSVNEDITDQDLLEYEVTANAFLLGGKVRIAAPIPWFAPFFEVGVGVSMGSFVTNTPNTNSNTNGVSMHIPFAIGVALGRNHNIEIGFTYYSVPAAQQLIGAAKIGVSIPIN